MLLPQDAGTWDTLHHVGATVTGRGERRIHYASTAGRGNVGYFTSSGCHCHGTRGTWEHKSTLEAGAEQATTRLTSYTSN
ncbi:hypothetical protein GCM10008014_39370 [Paenibacillus silvae]|uniref:Uncharacterized protein n=2 Tax=Paenibacillus silvae TaxID=1325358 RepID=A0ABQ1ZH66_9BACL|nr:hypothetical protein GCM10008014_39370 [Paenibacillus silvae]